MQYFNNMLCIEASWIVSQNILTHDNYHKMAQRNQIKVVRRSCRNTTALVEFDSMPERIKQEISTRIGGNPYEKVRVNFLEKMIEHSIESSEFFEHYKIDDTRYLPRETRHEYYINLIVLDAIHRMINEKKAKHSALGHKTTRQWDQLCEAVMDLDRTKYPHTLPANPRRLEDKYKRFVKEGIESLIHKNFTNKNAAKVDSDVKESMMMELLADPRNLDNSQVVTMYNLMAENRQWKKVTAATVSKWREKYDHMIFAGRRGSVDFRNKKSMQIKRSAPSCPLYYWTIDGWDVELLYQQAETGRTTYHNRPTVVVALDAFNKYPIGYAIGDHETPDLIKEALKNAVKHTEELYGQMYKTHQIQSDHYAIKTLSPLYESVAKHSTPARVKNAKAKIIEPYFASINKKYCQMQSNWSGFGITSNKDKQPNVEYLNKYKHSFPDWDGVVKQVEAIIEAERAEKREAMLAKWAEMQDEDKLEMPIEKYLLAFGQETGRKNLLQGTGL